MIAAPFRNRLVSLVALLSVACQFAKKDDGSNSNNDQTSSGDDTTISGDGDQSNGTTSGGTNGGSERQEKKGERGSSCDSANDCDDDLSCIVTDNCPVGVACANKSCQPSNFEIIGTGKQCKIQQCETKADCCGDMPLDAPEKCKVRDNVCFRPTAPGCETVVCTEDAECGAGRCTGVCAYDSEDCMSATDCAPNVCDLGSGGSNGTGGGSGGDGSGGSGASGGTGTCSLSGTTCTSDANCGTNSCSSVYCRCENPDYDPEDPICDDEDCDGICGFTCENELCVIDDSCGVDEDCLDASVPYCSDGACVECRMDEDCEDEECLNGHCGPLCESDVECGLFEMCDDNQCKYVGCQSDRECILSASETQDQDPRLYQCHVVDGIGTCRFPCDIDAQCPRTQVCLDGLCEYIGCESDSECKTIAGLHNQPLPTDEQPWTTTAICIADPSN